MTRSIVTGGVALVMIVFIVLSLVGGYDTSPAVQLSWGLVGFVATILFARFGGFKPFFESDPDPPEGIATTSAAERAAGRLVSVGATTDPVVKPPTLFNDREPFETASPPVDEATDDGDDAAILERRRDDATDNDQPDTSPLFDETTDDDATDNDQPDTSAIFDEEPTEGRAGPDPEHPAMDKGVGRTLVAAPARADVTVTTAAGAQVELHKYSSSEIAAVVKAQEGALVETLIGEGLLTTYGPITDRDVRTMVFVAVSSNELVELLTSEPDEGHSFWPPRPAELAEGGAA